MDKIQFAPAIDVPLTLIVLAGFMLHFQSWARNKDVDTSVDSEINRALTAGGTSGAQDKLAELKAKMGITS